MLLSSWQALSIGAAVALASGEGAKEQNKVPVIG